MTEADREADRAAKLMGRLRRAIADDPHIEAHLIVSALMGVLSDYLSRLRSPDGGAIGATELGELLGLMPTMIADWHAKPAPEE
jgi:hypothetical protein